MKYPRIRSKSVITAAIAIGMFLSLTTARSEPTTSGGGSPRQRNDLSIDLAFVTHLDLGLPEQDVFIERVAGSGEVYRRRLERLVPRWVLSGLPVAD